MFQKREKVTVSLPPDLAKWARVEARREHTTLSGLVLFALKAYRDRKLLEEAAVSARAVLEMTADGWARGDAAKAGEYREKYLARAKKELGL
ncbi:MAG: hypothetical protein ACPLRW_11600 [Moorellales bacterium]